MTKLKRKIILLALVSSLGFVPSAHAAWWDDVGNWFVNAANDVGDWFVNAAEDVGEWFENAFDDVTEAFADAANFFEDVAQTIGDEIVGAYNDVESQMSGWFVVDTPNSPSTATAMTTSSYDLNTTDTTLLTGFRARQQTYRDNLLTNFANDTNPNAKLDLVVGAYTGNALDTTYLADELADTQASKNSDMGLLVFVRMLYYTNVYDSQIMTMIDQLPKWIHEEGGEKKMYNSENHLIMWMSANWLLDQRAGVTPSSYERNRLEHWLDLKIDHGYYEWNSLVYFPYTLGALLNLYDFATDAVIKEKSRKAALILIHDLMLITTEQGNAWGTSGRDYSSKYEDEMQRNHTIGRILSMLTGANDSYTDGSGAGPVDLLATTTLDVSPALRQFGKKVNVTYRIGHNDSKSFVNNLHSGLNLTDKALFQMSAGSYAHPDYLADMLAMMAQNNIEGSDEAVGLLAAFIDGPLEPIIGGGVSLGGAFSYSSLLMDKTADVYRDGGAMLSSVDNYHGGRAGWQQTTWSATTGGSTVYTRSGKNRGGWKVGGQGMMNTHLPYVTQTDNVALIIYKAKPELRLVNSLLPDLIDFGLDVNLHWEESAFDETATNGNWIFGREGDNYVAVFRHCLGTKTITEKIDNVDTDIEIMSCSSNQQVWASVVGTADSHGSFISFIATVSAAKIKSEWNWNFTKAKHVWQTTLSVDGVQIGRNIDRNVDDLFEGDTWELGSIVNTSGLSIETADLDMAPVGGTTISGVDEQWHTAGLSSCTSGVHLHSLGGFGGSDPTMVRTYTTNAYETPVSFTNWQSGEPNNSGGRESCVHMRSDNGNWNDAHCSGQYYHACRNDLGEWKLSASNSHWGDGVTKCPALGGTYSYQAPVNAEDHAKLKIKAAGKNVWINVNDGVTPNTWMANRNVGSCQVMAQEEQSLDSEMTHADENIDFISFGSAEFLGGESGTVSVDHDWKQIDLGFNYDRPVVFASINTFNGGDPAIAEVRNITPTSFEVRVAEFEYKDVTHAYETISYVVMNAGEYDLGDGRFLEVGTAGLTTVFDGSPNFQNIGVGVRDYQLITQVQGNNAGRIVGARVDNKNPGSFDASLMVQESSRANAGTIQGVLGYMALGERNYQLTTIKVALKGVHGKYFVAEGNGGGDANANRTAIGSYEKFNMISANDVPGCIRDGDKVVFLAEKGYYLKGHSNGNVTFDRSVAAGADTWETWRVDNYTNPNGCLKNGDKVYLTVEVHGKRLQANSNGDARLSSNWGSWERQEVIFLD